MGRGGGLVMNFFFLRGEMRMGGLGGWLFLVVVVVGRWWRGGAPWFASE